MRDPRLDRLANLLCDYSVRIKKGDKVLVSAEDVCTPWIQAVVEAALLRGAHVETDIRNAGIEEIIMRRSTDEQFAHPHMIREHMMKNIDVWLTAWGTVNLKDMTGVESSRLRSALSGKKSWRDVYHKRMNDGTLRWCGCQFPTQADAQEAGMSLTEYEDFVFTSCLLDAADPVAAWRKVSEEQEKWVKFLTGKKEFRFVSRDTDITVRTDNRAWENCDGSMNMPDGEVCVAPVEDSMNGHIRFSYPAIYAGKEVEDIRLEVKHGRVVKATAARGEDLLNELIRTDDGASRFGEIAIGTNYNIRRFTKNMLFDEKIGGTVHFALGSPVTEEGTNVSSLHWDMICEMRPDGEIYADGELFYKNGKFLGA